MEKAISAAEANRKFSQILQGEKTQVSARETLLARLRRQPIVRAERWTRDELYEDAPTLLSRINSAFGMPLS